MWLHVRFQSEATLKATNMKTLAVFVLAVLGWSLTDGRNVSVCELTGQLRSAAANQTVLSGSVLNNTLAKVVCYTKTVSNLNTSAETHVTVVGHDNSGENHGGGKGDQQEGGGSEEHRPLGRGRRSSKGGDSREHHPGSSSSTSPPPQSCTLYGIFQLSSCQACNDSVTPTANICGLSCSHLVDDDITNDVACLLKVIAAVENPSSVWQELKESPGEFWKIRSSQCSDVSAYKC